MLPDYLTLYSRTFLKRKLDVESGRLTRSTSRCTYLVYLGLQDECRSVGVPKILKKDMTRIIKAMGFPAITDLGISESSPSNLNA